MKLRDYLRERRITVREFALAIGQSDTVVRKWVYGQRQPSLPNAIKVESATGGIVSTRDLLLRSAPGEVEPAFIDA